MSDYIDADFAVVCDEWRPTVTSERSKSMSEDKMKPSTILEVIETLIGDIDPVGDSYFDGMVSQNLDRFIEVIGSLIEQVETVAMQENSPYFSVAECGRKARFALKDWVEEMEDFTKEQEHE